MTEAGHTAVWERIEAAHAWWEHTGHPSWDRYGLTATSTDQRVWFDTPGNSPHWPLAI